MAGEISELDPTLLDKTGKVVLDHVYNQDRPAAYYRAIDELDYHLPQQAKPLFAGILDMLRRARGRDALKIVDLGCSYGVNAALLKWGFDLEQLFEHYRRLAASGDDRASCVAADRRWLRRQPARPYDFIGVDCARNALDYALEAGLIDAKIVGNFEAAPLSASQRLRIGGADLIMSTGCIGYVSERTLAALMDAAEPGEPWMAHCVLRMFPFEPIGELLAARGYRTLRSRRPVRQRRFASRVEQQKALERLDGLGVDTRGHEADGWYYADLYLSRPQAAADLPLPAGLAAVFAA
jgi:hypothetical protein